MSNRIDLRQLRAFHAVLTGGSVTAASERLNLGQPTISKQLTALEEALKIKLFDRRSGTPVSPTVTGIEFFKAIESTISCLDNLETIARDITECGRRRIRIAATPPILNSQPFMDGLSRFMSMFPEIKLALEARSRVEIEDWAIRGEVDVAFALLPSIHTALITEPFVSTYAVATMHYQHALAHEDDVTMERLSGHKLILPSRQPLRTRIDMTLEREGHQIYADIESSSANNCCRLALAGLGIALCDPFSPTAFETDKLVVKPWSPRVRLSYGMIRNGMVENEPVFDTLLDIMKEEFARFMPADGSTDMDASSAKARVRSTPE